MEIYEQKCNDSILSEVEAIESQIRQELITTPQELLKEIDQLKTSFTKKTATIIYKLKDLVITATCEKILMKGFECIIRKDKEQLTNNVRQLTDKVHYLEKDLSGKKKDYENEKSQYQTKIFEAYNEL